MAMEIEGWAIDAFGALSDAEHRGVNSGLSVIYGPNEAGKSTLRHFVLGVLFGFSPSTGRDLPYSPSSGGFRSGRLFLRNDDEELTITRVEQRNARGGVVTLLGADGTARADAELAALLGGLNRQVYNRIFAVGLDELNDLAALTDGDLQDHLLSAGVTGAGRIATQARNKLRIRAEELHKPRAPEHQGVVAARAAAGHRRGAAQRPACRGRAHRPAPGPGRLACQRRRPGHPRARRARQGRPGPTPRRAVARVRRGR